MMTLRPYQISAIESVEKSIAKGQTMPIIVMATGLGKAQPLSSRVLTPTGWKLMAEIFRGLEVISADGQPTQVLEIYPQGVRKVFKVTCSDGTSTRCDGEHLWSVQTKSQKFHNRGFQTKTTLELIQDLKDGSGANKWFLPVVKPVHFQSRKPWNIHPWLLGVLIANGSLRNTLNFSTADQYIVATLMEHLNVMLDELTLYKHSTLVKELKRLNLWGKYSYEKNIPYDYLYTNSPDRLCLLQGLMDCDGTISKDGTCEYDTSSPYLANDVCELVRSLGGTTTIRVRKEPKYTHKGEKRIGRPNYRITVSLSQNPFSISRKAEKWLSNPKQGRTKAIVSIVPDGEEECQCIEVANPSHLYVTDEYIVTHNTVVFSHIINDRHRPGKKALVLAHREELLTQARDKIRRVEPKLRVEIEMADKYANDERADVIVASVATLGREGGKRIQRFNPNHFNTIIIDEAHHASANSYQNVLKHFGVLKGVNDWRSHATDPTLLLGVTATPNRNDNQGIDQIFDDVVFNYGIVEGIKDGWLSRIHAYRVDTATNLEAVHTRAGDFAIDELSDAVNNEKRNKLVVDTYKENFEGKQALVFAVKVAHAEALNAEFKSQGVHSAMIDGTTPKDIRAKILKSFHTKTTQVVVNCMVLTEGYDNDTIDAIFMARPTKSGILYTQMIGRGTRTHADKPYLTVVDFVDNTSRHILKSAASLLGLDATIQFSGEDVIDSLTQIEQIQELAPDYDLSRLDMNHLDYVMEEVDLLSGLEIPTPLTPHTQFVWQRFGKDAYRIGLGNNVYLVMEQSLIGNWKTREEIWDPVTHKLSKEELGEELVLEDIVKRTDQYITANYPESLILIDSRADWTRRPVKDTQVGALRKLGVSNAVIEGLNRGKAARLQNKLYNQITLKQQWHSTAKRLHWR